MRPPFFKRRYFVNGFQYRLMYGNFLYLITTVLVFFVAIFGPVIVTLDNNALAQEQREVAARQLLVLHERVWYAVPIIILLCVSIPSRCRTASPARFIVSIKSSRPWETATSE